jgi:hypothetical protein
MNFRGDRASRYAAIDRELKAKSAYKEAMLFDEDESSATKDLSKMAVVLPKEAIEGAQTQMALAGVTFMTSLLNGAASLLVSRNEPVEEDDLQVQLSALNDNIKSMVDLMALVEERVASLESKQETNDRYTANVHSQVMEIKDKLDQVIENPSIIDTDDESVIRDANNKPIKVLRGKPQYQRLLVRRDKGKGYTPDSIIDSVSQVIIDHMINSGVRPSLNSIQDELPISLSTLNKVCREELGGVNPTEIVNQRVDEKLSTKS